jgi:hypothetical protein
MLILVILNSLNLYLSIQIVFIYSISLIILIFAIITFQNIFFWVRHILKRFWNLWHIIEIFVIIWWLICNTMLQSELLLFFKLLKVVPRRCSSWLCNFLVRIALSKACFRYLYWVIVFSNSHVSQFIVKILPIFKNIINNLFSHVWSWIVHCCAWETTEPSSWFFFLFCVWMQKFIFIFLLNHFYLMIL